MGSSSVNSIVYYDGVIITTKHGSMFVSGSRKIVQLDNKMSFDALKQAIGNNISLPNGQVVKDIHFCLPVLFVGDCGKYMTCMLHNDEDARIMFFMYADISKLACLELYITIADPPIQTCAHPPSISVSSFNFEDLDEYLAQAMNHESSFE
ncbi:hypothetical protein HKD37_20G056558 [Glycine soja]